MADVRESGQAVEDVSYGTILDGTKTVAATGTPEAVAGSTPILGGVLIQALSTNTKSIKIGNATTQNTELQPTDAVYIRVNNLNLVFVKVQVNGEGVAYLALAS